MQIKFLPWHFGVVLAGFSVVEISFFVVIFFHVCVCKSVFHLLCSSLGSFIHAVLQQYGQFGGQETIDILIMWCYLLNKWWEWLRCFLGHGLSESAEISDTILSSFSASAVQSQLVSALCSYDSFWHVVSLCWFPPVVIWCL